MDIVVNTPERLVLSTRHTVIAGIMWGCSMILLWGMAHKWSELDTQSAWGIGLSALAFGVVSIYLLRPAVWSFDKVTNLFEWRRPGFLRSHTGFAPLDSIRRVRIDKSTGDNGGELFRIVAETPGNTVPFHPMFQSGRRQDYQSHVDMIRAWLAH